MCQNGRLINLSKYWISFILEIKAIWLVIRYYSILDNLHGQIALISKNKTNQAFR